MVARAVNSIFYFYTLLLFIRIFLTWIPSTDWYAQPFAWLKSITDPFLNIFRNIIPPIGGMLDISPILAFIVLQLVQGLLVGFLSSLGL